MCVHHSSFLLPTAQNQIDAVSLGHVFDRTTATYKYLWFLAILDSVCSDQAHIDSEGCARIPISDLYLLMIAKSWVPTQRFRLNFGRWDNITEIVNQLKSSKLFVSQDSDSELDAKRSLESFRQTYPAEFNTLIYKRLDRYVKDKFLTPFKDSSLSLYSINKRNDIFEIQVPAPWVNYLRDHYILLKDFALWNFSSFLEKRNQNVPGLAFKLSFLKREGLQTQTKFWRPYIEENHVVTDIYGNSLCDSGTLDFALDHFLPWHFLAHNEIWNLTPSNPRINASKSDLLPDTERFVPRLAKQHQDLIRFHLRYGTSSKTFFDQYENFFGCAVGDIAELAPEDLTDLFESRFKPLEQTALNMGFKQWQIT